MSLLVSNYCTVARCNAVPQKKSGPSVSSTATRVLPSRSPQVPSSRAVRPSSSRQGNSNHLAVPLLSSMPRTYAVGRCSAERYAALDKHALSCPASRTQSVASLVSYLKQVSSPLNFDDLDPCLPCPIQERMMLGESPSGSKVQAVCMCLACNALHTEEHEIL